MKKTKLSVRLYGNNHIIGLYKTNYIGLLGMHIDADPLMFPKGTQMEVAILLDGKAGASQCRLPVVVTSRSLHGVGLTFFDLDDHMCSTLQDIVFGINEESEIMEQGDSIRWSRK